MCDMPYCPRTTRQKEPVEWRGRSANFQPHMYLHGEYGWRGAQPVLPDFDSGRPWVPIYYNTREALSQGHGATSDELQPGVITPRDLEEPLDLC